MQPLSLGRLRFTNVLLLSLDWCRPKDPPISLGAASILTQLQKGGVAATALQYNVNDPKFDSDAVVNCVFAQKPDRRTLLGIGAFVWNEPHLQRILSLLRQYRFPGSILLGGPQISYTTCNPTLYYPTVLPNSSTLCFPFLRCEGVASHKLTSSRALRYYTLGIPF